MYWNDIQPVKNSAVKMLNSEAKDQVFRSAVHVKSPEYC